MKCEDLTPNFDLIVVGAGPAGSASAFTAAEQGLSVLLLEEHPKIGHPVVCAEGLSRSTIKDYLKIRPEWISQELSGAIIRGPSGDEFKVDYPNVGWILDRDAFDLALAKIAEESGAVVKTKSRVVGIKDNKVVVRESGRLREYQFQFLIGADGIASTTGRWMGIDTRLKLSDIGVCAEYTLENIRVVPNYVQLIFGKEYAPGGYAWIFPKDGHCANVGLGISSLKTKRCAKFFLDNWVQKEFPQAVIKKRIFGGVPATVLKRISGKNFFLVGDAARLTDPLSGAGIANGIKSGVIAGRNVILRLKGKKDYFEAEIEKEIRREIKFHYRVRNIYLKLRERDYNEVFKIGRGIFEGKKIADINTHRLVKEILFSSPQLLRFGINLLF